MRLEKSAGDDSRRVIYMANARLLTVLGLGNRKRLRGSIVLTQRQFDGRAIVSWVRGFSGQGGHFPGTRDLEDAPRPMRQEFC
jgi:hypothetical protein